MAMERRRQDGRDLRETKSPIGRRLRGLRNVADISALETSILSGRGRTHVHQIEVSEAPSSLTLGVVESIARTLGASPAWLAFGEGDAPSEAAVKQAVGRARARQEKERAT